MSQYAFGPPLGYVQLTVTTSTAQSLSATAPKGTRTALIATETNGIRFRDDGTAPTSAVGFPIFAASPTVPVEPFVYQGNVLAIQIIAQSTGTAIVDISYYGG